MRKKAFRILRKKLVNKKWLNHRYKQLLEDNQELEIFYEFECSNFFRGYQLASYNREIYFQSIAQNEARIKYVKKHLDNLKTL